MLRFPYLAALVFASALATNGAQAQALLQDAAGNCATPQPFTQALTDKPIPLYKPDEEITPAVENFHCTGEDSYNGDEQAIADGKKLFNSLCAGCHMPTGKGGMGPNLVDDTYRYPRVATDHGLFEVIYGGATGAMQPMGRRFTQDQILRIIAYVYELSGK